MKGYLGNFWFKIGLVLVVVGWGPLLAIILLAAIGLWPDPNPNPIGPGLLFFFTSWPAIICLGIGVVQVRRRLSRIASSPIMTPRGPELASSNSHAWLGHPIVRLVGGVGGLALMLRGATGVLADEGRGAAAAIVLGVVAVYWAVVGRIPSWFLR
jgi:hypothetical protein